VLIEEIKCKNKMELHRRERHFIETLKAELNSVIPTRTDKEYYQMMKEERPEKLKEASKKYRDAHKEAIDLKTKNRFEDDEYRAKRYEQMKKTQSYLVTRFEKKNCECGGKFMPTSKAKHCRSTLHQTFINGGNN
jgi:hypothetical protein